MLKEIFNKKFGYFIAIFAGIEVFSYLATFVPALNGFIVILIALSVFLISRKNLFFGLQIAVAELIIGSKGYLFAFSINGVTISVRLAIFITLFLTWLIYYSTKSNFWKLIRNKLEIIIILAFLILLIIGVINGFIHNYPIMNIFNDVNGYLYLALLPIFYDAIGTKERFYQIIQILIAGSFFIAIQTLFLAYVFFHNIEVLNYFMYKWVRLAGLGEITKLSPDSFFYRIFLQAQIYLIPSIAILSAILWSAKSKFKIFSLLAVNFSALIISGSRSLWVGAIAVFGSLGLHSIYYAFKNKQFKPRIQYLSAILSSLIFGAVLIMIVANFPLPYPKNFYSFNLIGQRLTASEPAVSTRWKEFFPLINVIKKSPIIGSGFGTTATFNSDDPRIKNQSNPSGEVTTFSFEWGYLDTITEVGLLGLTTFLLFLASLIYYAYKKLTMANDEDEKLLTISLMIGMISLAVIHTFSPYLNHPLGLGFLMITMAWLGLPKIIQTSDRSNTGNH